MVTYKPNLNQFFISTCETLLPLKPLGNLTKKGSITRNSRFVRTCSIKRISWKLSQNSQKISAMATFISSFTGQAFTYNFSKKKYHFHKMFFLWTNNNNFFRRKKLIHWQIEQRISNPLFAKFRKKLLWKQVTFEY